MNVKTVIRNAARKRGYELRDANYLPQSHERKIYEYYLKEPEGIKTIFDVGANIGQTAVAFHESFPEADIYSFEPFALAYKTLVENTAHLPNVRCVPEALGDTNTTMMALSHSDDRSDINSLTSKKQQELNNQGETETETITIRTGERFCSENNINLIDVLKIDTEGFEVPVLNGFGHFLNKGVRSILCEFCLLENRANLTSLIALHALLQPKGFELASVYDIRHEADGAFHYGNALFVHSDHLRVDRRW